MKLTIQGKFKDIIMRRLKRGECYHMPYFGCREFPANFELCKEEEIHTAYDDVEEKDFGFMLYDIDYSDKENLSPMFFRAIMKQGIIDVQKLRGGSMILQALVKYYEDLEKQGNLPRQGWCQEKVSYGINLSTDGNIKNIIWLKDEIQAGKKRFGLQKQCQFRQCLHAHPALREFLSVTIRNTFLELIRAVREKEL